MARNPQCGYVGRGICVTYPTISRNAMPTTVNQPTDTVLAFMADMPSLTRQEKEEIAQHLVVQTYPKGTILVAEGDIGNQCYFVLKGCLRQFRTVEGVEKTVQFYTEHQAATLFTSYSTLSASEDYLTA